LQSFANEFKSTATSDAYKVISGFPSFAVGETSADLGYMAHNGMFAGWMKNATGRYPILWQIFYQFTRKLRSCAVQFLRSFDVFPRSHNFYGGTQFSCTVLTGPAD